MPNKISVVIPVYNEQESIPHLAQRLLPIMKGMDRPWEVLFINDGSKDGSFALLHDLYRNERDNVRIVDMNGNFGQHMAIIAGFSVADGDYVITMDADMQTPPEEIPRIVAEMDAGHDVVGTYRENRHDPIFRKVASKAVNMTTNKITGLKIKDYGCMLRGYSMRIVRIILDCGETNTFIPALAQRFASNPSEIPISHSAREYGTSKYGIFRLVRLNFDLMTSFSLVPLQVVTMSGIALSAASVLFFVFLIVRRLIVGSEAEGVFTLMAIQFCLTGITLLSVGLCGEYIGRIYVEVRRRPRYIIRSVLGKPDDGRQTAVSASDGGEIPSGEYLSPPKQAHMSENAKKDGVPKPSSSRQGNCDFGEHENVC